MRWLILVLLITAIAITFAEPEPKKYKPEVKTKDESTSLTKDEKMFLREVESKFGIKSDVPLDKIPEEEGINKKELSEEQVRAPFPAVIAIEIVNDTDDKDTPSKGKRTIDANLGYGYQTNNGYAYTYFGQSQNKPKFMYYPYSQEDIPPSNTHSSGNTYNTPGSNLHSPKAVEITPSQAFELVQMKEESTAYNYKKPSKDFKSEDNIQSVEQPPPSYGTSESYRQATPQTFYTTYNGQQLSGLSGQFPSVMSNYLVDSSQLLKSSQYQSAGLTQAHFQHGAQQEQKVVPVLVLRVPSTYLKKPTAELYANAPQSVSQYLNVNLQELVNQYFRKLGFHQAPQVMAYQDAGSHEEIAAPVASYEPNKYASPYVQPTYTHADSAGVQYSAVQPVMARYPAGYTRQQYYANHGQHYQQPKEQQYVYRYRYETPDHSQAYYNQAQYSPQAHQQQSPEQTQAYYEQAQAYQQAQQLAAHTAQQAEVAAQQAQAAVQQAYSQQQQSTDQETSHESAHGHADAAYSQQQETSREEESTSVVYESLKGHSAANSVQGYVQSTPGYEIQTVTPQYETHTEVSSEYGAPVPSHDNTQTQKVQYEEPQPVEVYPRSQAGHSHPETDSSQTYQYQTNFNGHVGHEDADTLPLSENYPSKDHTIATILPLSYKSRVQHPEAVQSVSYVTPMPSSMKYHSQFRVMVPQTVFNRPTESKVSYVNSHSIQNAYLQSSRYNGGKSQYAPAARHMHYPWNIHTLPKRMVRLQRKSDTETVSTNDKALST